MNSLSVKQLLVAVGSGCSESSGARLDVPRIDFVRLVGVCMLS